MIVLSTISKDFFLELALKENCRIGIGSKENPDIIKDSILECKKLGMANIEIYSDPENLIEDLKEGRIDAAVRGTMASSNLINLIKTKFDLKEIIRAAVLFKHNKSVFILGPVGIDEGSSIDDKINLVDHSVNFLKKFKVDAKIAVLSGGRTEDVGRSERVDSTLKEAEVLCEKIRTLNYIVENYGVRIEDAVKNSNIVIVPDGIIGNFIFRTFYHLGDGESFGAPILNLPKIFIDTSRTKKDYTSAVILAAALKNIVI